MLPALRPRRSSMTINLVGLSSGGLQEPTYGRWPSLQVQRKAQAARQPLLVRRRDMKRETGFLVLALVMTLGLSSVTVRLFGQDTQNQPSPALPPEVLGPQLIAWSQLQSPQPLRQARSTQDKEPTAQTFTGRIMRDGSTYLLKVSTGTAYPVAEWQRAKPYEGKQVRISGVLDANGESLHILSIEPVS